ncbi:MAG TPA: sulfotransferase [Thermoanaerobaculia bacterium]|nr:sulfotransferase [Thermoanaerobaculia bacterium]
MRTTIVTGLPRSGTSLTMQMLHAGGMECATDGVRTADADNPRGYFESEHVKQLAGDDPAAVMREVAGRAVKIIHWLLFRLPAPFDADVLVLRRDPREVIASQSVMLERRGHYPTRASDERLAAMCTRELELLDQWLARRTDLRVLDVHYADVIDDPHAQAVRIAAFLRRNLDVCAMARAVDATLYRQRAEVTA